MAISLKGKRILLVDDDETITTPFQLILQNAGYQVDIALTGQQALEKLEETDYQVAILDIILPDIKGEEIARKIRKQNDDIRFIIITGHSEIDDSVEAIDVGIDDILLKPIEPDELLRTVKESFDEHEKVRHSKVAIPP